MMELEVSKKWKELTIFFNEIVNEIEGEKVMNVLENTNKISEEDLKDRKFVINTRKTEERNYLENVFKNDIQKIQIIGGK